MAENFPKYPFQMCAWGKERDACPGDSGGPLAVIEDGNYVLIGLVRCITTFNVDKLLCGSYGRKECVDKWVCNVCGLKAAGIYTRVQAYLTWIHSIMQGAGFKILGKGQMDISKHICQEILGALKVFTLIRAMSRVGASNTKTTRKWTNVPNFAAGLQNAAALSTVLSIGLFFIFILPILRFSSPGCAI